MKKRLLIFLVTLLMIISAGLGITQAQEDTPVQAPPAKDGEVAELVTPKSYSSCYALLDLISVYGIEGYELKGQIIGDYMLVGGAREQFLYLPVNVSGQKSFATLIFYPSTSEWEASQVHFDIQLELWAGNEMIQTLGPQKDWAVTCESKSKSVKHIVLNPN